MMIVRELRAAIAATAPRVRHPRDATLAKRGGRDCASLRSNRRLVRDHERDKRDHRHEHQPAPEVAGDDRRRNRDQSCDGNLPLARGEAGDVGAMSLEAGGVRHARSLGAPDLIHLPSPAAAGEGCRVSGG